jgi:hypothetical protein
MVWRSLRRRLFHSPCVKSRLIHRSVIKCDLSWIVHLLRSKNTIMLKLIITECGGSPTEWEWRVCDAGRRESVVQAHRFRRDDLLYPEKHAYTRTLKPDSAPAGSQALWSGRRSLRSAVQSSGEIGERLRVPAGGDELPARLRVQLDRLDPFRTYF